MDGQVAGRQSNCTSRWGELDAAGFGDSEGTPGGTGSRSQGLYPHNTLITKVRQVMRQPGDGAFFCGPCSSRPLARRGARSYPGARGNGQRIFRRRISTSCFDRSGWTGALVRPEAVNHAASGPTSLLVYFGSQDGRAVVIS